MRSTPTSVLATTFAPASTRANAADERRALRAAFGEFATGVAIATARADDGRLAGVTINSFASVSLDPPLVVWCLATSASSLPVFAGAPHHAINVLASVQLPLAQRFAAHGVDRFAGVAWREGAHGAVLIDGALAYFVCRVRELRETGDHVLIVGDVADFCRYPGEPLVFHGGRYWATGRRLDSAAPVAVLVPPREAVAPR
jgi:unspecific monooxygenase